MSKLRVCVLQSCIEGSSAVLSSVDPYREPEAYDTAHEFEWSTVYVRKATSAAQLTELAASGKYDVYLNLCDGAWDEDRAGRDVVEALERLNLPYTGANLAFYEPTKVEMKMAEYWGVTVPAWVHIQAHRGPRGEHLPGRGVEAGLAAVLAGPQRGGLSFPLIVKHPSGYSSVGMSRASKVTDAEQLRQQVTLLVQQYGGALVEEFIPGREFTVLVVEEPGVAEPEGGAAGGGEAAPNGAPVDAHGAPNGAPAPQGGAPNGAPADAAMSLDPDLCAFRPVAYTPVECVFSAGEDFKHFELKWKDYESLSWRPCDDPQLAERLKDAACKTFVAMRGVSYGRCDFRLSPSGELFMLEINANCGVLYPPGQHGSADYILTLDPAHDHMAFIRSIIASALRRHALKQPKVGPAYFRRPRQPAPPAPAPAPSGADAGPEAAAAAANGGGGPAGPPEQQENGGGGGGGAGGGAGGWGLVALVPIRPGEVVQRNEQRPKVLASRGFVERCWPVGSRQRQWFDEYAYPVSDEVWVTWSDNPADWAPLNHSCDPNCWLRGMDMVARRDIATGEQITIDYATFTTEHMAPFDCDCGAAACRRRVTGSDHLQPWVGERYGDHVFPYVAEKRRRAGLAPQSTQGQRAPGA